MDELVFVVPAFIFANPFKSQINDPLQQLLILAQAFIQFLYQFIFYLIIVHF
ncbi:hypothetical protein D9M68_663970 [compost metagenome]